MALFSFFKRKSTEQGFFSLLLNNVKSFFRTLTYKTAYKGWVYACVNVISDEVASVELTLKKRGKTADDDIEVTNHPALDLLRGVNKFMSRYDLLKATQSYLDLDGNSFWYVVRSLNSKPTELWYLEPEKVQIVEDETNFISGYVYTNRKGKNIPLGIEEVIHFKTFNPNNMMRGMGTVEASSLAIDTDDKASKYNNIFFTNSARPDGILSTEGKLTDQQFLRLKEQWDSEHRGIENAHKTAILEGGLKFQQISLSQKDMDYLEQRRFSRDEILALFRVPKSIVGITEDVNRANAEASGYQFARYTIKPKMRFLVDKLNEFYLPLFPNTENLYFDFKDPVPENEDLEIRRKQAGIQSGYYTINEVRAEEGKPPVAGGDIPYIPFNNIPLSDAGNTDSSTTPVQDPNQGKAVKKDVLHTKMVHLSKYVKYQAIITKQNKLRTRFIALEMLKRRKQFKKIITDMQKQIIEKLDSKKDFVASITKDRGSDLVQFLFENWKEWIGIVYNPVDDTLKASLAQAGRDALATVGVNIDFNTTSPRVLDWLSENALKHATSIPETIKDDVAVVIMQGVEQGKNSTEIAKDINNLFNLSSTWRAERIARTEVMAGYGAGQLEGYIQSEVVKGKEWFTGGSQPCEHCIDNEAQGVIPLTDSFNSGDGAEPAHPNCECRILPVV